MPTDQLANPAWWETMARIFGPGGLVLLLTNAGSYYVLWLLWKRLKEKDDECKAEMDKAEARWEVRFQQMRGDIKEGFGIVAENTKQTILLAATVTNTRLREN